MTATTAFQMPRPSFLLQTNDRHPDFSTNKHKQNTIYPCWEALPKGLRGQGRSLTGQTLELSAKSLPLTQSATPKSKVHPRKAGR